MPLFPPADLEELLTDLLHFLGKYPPSRTQRIEKIIGVLQEIDLGVLESREEQIEALNHLADKAGNVVAAFHRVAVLCQTIDGTDALIDLVNATEAEYVTANVDEWPYGVDDATLKKAWKANVTKEAALKLFDSDEGNLDPEKVRKALAFWDAEQVEDANANADA